MTADTNESDRKDDKMPEMKILAIGSNKDVTKETHKQDTSKEDTKNVGAKGVKNVTEIAMEEQTEGMKKKE
jgi:hypothetical protein